MRLTLIGAASALTVGLAGCGTYDVDNGKPYGLYKNPSVALWIDPETKCEYIGGTASAALMPRFDRHGKQICR